MYFALPALAGAIDGAAIAAIGMLYSAATGGGFWSLPNSIGGIVLGPEVGDRRSLGLVTFVGICFHMVLSALYGILTVYLAHSFKTGFISTGISVGIFVWLFNRFLVGSVLPGAKNTPDSIRSGWRSASTSSTAPSPASWLRH
jgi:hypothetical protein